MLLLDTSAWVEFFLKSKKGGKIKNYLRTQTCYTSILTIAEISNWAMKENVNGRDLINIIIKLTHVLNLSIKISFLAGELNFQQKKLEKNWGMADSIIFATSQIFNLKILTKDSHFQNLPDVEMI